MEKKTKARKCLPLLLTLAIVIADQATKLLVIRNIPENTLYRSYWNDFLWIVHVRNTGAAFSMGDSLPDFLRIVCFIVIPVALMALLIWAAVSPKSKFTKAQRWFAAGIAGGGIGTVIDRVLRFGEGVVDFISVKFFGIFGMDRWPTFNVSDSCVVIFVILFALSVLFQGSSKEEK